MVNSAIANKAFPGAVIFVEHNDSIFLHKAYGFHTYDSLHRTRTNDLFDLASITKVTAGTLAMMKMYEDQLFKLEDPIRLHFPEIKGKRGKATIRALLAHHSGWQDWIAYHRMIRRKNGQLKPKYVKGNPTDKYDFKLAQEKYLRKDFYNFIKKRIRKAAFDPNQGYVYSGLFFYLIPEFVLKKTGIDFETYLNKYFYGPMGTKSLGFNPLNHFDLNRIVPTEVDTFFRETTIHGWVHDEGAIMMRGISGNAGLFSTAIDLSKIWKMFLNNGMYENQQYLKEETIRLFTTCQYPNQGNRRGLGFDKPLLQYNAKMSSTAPQAGLATFGHTGYTGPIVWADPTRDLLFIFLCNRVYPTRQNKAIYLLNVRPNIHDLSYQLIGLND